MMAGMQVGKSPQEPKVQSASPQADPSRQQQGWGVRSVTWCLGGSKEEANGEGPKFYSPSLTNNMRETHGGDF